MKQSDLDSMSIDDLWKLHERIAATLTAKINAEKKALIDRLKQADMSVH
jgi:DNA-binding protein H-NS